MSLKVWHLFALIGFAALAIFGGIAGVMSLSNHQAAQTRTVVQVVSVADLGASNLSSAQANVRAAIPAMEAFNVDHATYAGATLANLQGSYDAGIKDVDVVSASASSYCVQSTVGDASAHKDGAAAQILTGTCP